MTPRPALLRPSARSRQASVPTLTSMPMADTSLDAPSRTALMDQVASLSKHVESLRIELRRSSRSRLIEQSEAFVGPKGQR